MCFVAFCTCINKKHGYLPCFWCQTKSEQATAIYTRFWELTFTAFCQTYLHPSTCLKKRGLLPFNLFQFSQLRIKTYWFWRCCDIPIFGNFRKQVVLNEVFSLFRPMIIARKNRQFLTVVCHPTQNMAKCRDVPKTQRNFQFIITT